MVVLRMWRVSRLLLVPLLLGSLFYTYSFVSLTYRLSTSQDDDNYDMDLPEVKEPAPEVNLPMKTKVKTPAVPDKKQVVKKDVPPKPEEDVVMPEDDDYQDTPWGEDEAPQAKSQQSKPAVTSRGDVSSSVKKEKPALKTKDQKPVKSTPNKVPVSSKARVPAKTPLPVKVEKPAPRPATAAPVRQDPPAPRHKLIHILSYQRSGSSFMGKLFDLNPDAFFVYEPLSMLFTAMYGIVEDRAIPNNIFFDHYGNFRNLTVEQADLMTWTLSRVFECHLSDLPVSMLISAYWHRYQENYMTAGKSYVGCLEKLPGLNFSAGQEGLGTCLEHLRQPCPRAYNTLHEDALERCRSVLYYRGRWTRSDDEELWTRYRGTEFYQYRQNFANYFSCMARLEPRVRECAVEHLDRQCAASPARVVKTVRAPIDIPRRLFDIYDRDLRLIHLLRDPRGVTLSRLRAEWAHGYFERQDPDPRVLADSYCRNALKDVADRRALEAAQPGHVVVELVYDHFMLNLTANVERLFHALDMESSLAKIQHLIVGKADVDRKDRWRTWLKMADIRAIEKACPDFMARYKIPIYVP